MNSVRLLTASTSADKALPAIVMKLMFVIWNVQCAMQQAAYFLASRNGNFQRVLDDIRIKSASSGAFVRRLASRFTVVTWLMVVLDFAFHVYTICFSGGLMDVFLAPFGTYINFPQFTSLRPVFVIICIHLHPAWCFPVAMTFALSCIIAYQFRNIADNMRHISNDAENPIGISDADIEEIRLQHQDLCLIVNRADRFLKLYHMAAFFGPLIEVISIVYIVLLYPSQVKNSFILIFAFGFWLITYILQLGLVVGGGILVNHYVCIYACQSI
jgi:polyferredoxin